MVEEFKTAFHMFDRDGNGKIDDEELMSIMHTLGVEASKEEVGELLRSADKDGNGTIDITEFITLMSDKMV